jgi:hypothetical protein
MNKSRELSNILEHLDTAKKGLSTVVVCAEAVVSEIVAGRERRTEIVLPMKWEEMDLAQFFKGLDRPWTTLRKCTVWLFTNDSKTWIQYDCEYPTDHPVWGYHEDEPGSRRPQIPKSLEQSTIRWIDLDSPFSSIWAAIPEEYKYIAADRPLNELGEHPLISDLHDKTICTVFAYKEVPQAGINHWFTNTPGWIKLGTIPSSELPGPWNVCIAKRPGV